MTAVSPNVKKWLDAIKDRIASSLTMEQDDFAYAPFTQMGGLGAAYRVFGGELEAVLAEVQILVWW